MTQTRKHIIDLLLTRHYLRHSVSITGTACYKLYDPAGSPVKRVSQATIDKLDRFIDPKIKIWKIVRPGKITLNLSSVRRLHGRSYIKKAYLKTKKVK